MRRFAAIFFPAALTFPSIGADLLETLRAYAGIWELDAEHSDNIEQAIERTVSHASFLIRGTARTKLRKRNLAFLRMEIVYNDQGLRVKHQGGTDILYARSGVAFRAKDPSGDPMTVRLDADPVLTLTYETGEGRRADRYLLANDGRSLTVEVTVASSHLPQPLEYRLQYTSRK